MLIECRARRVARDARIGRKDRDLGTKSRLFGKVYHFRPQADLVPETMDSEAHICKVTDDRAIRRFIEELPEQFNELGKPPRVSAAAAALETSGQPAIMTELVDADDELGESDAPAEVDPLRHARALHNRWLEEMLEQPVRSLVSDLSRFNTTELDELMNAERKGKKRESLYKALGVARELAVEREESAPVMPPDDNDDIQVE
jgi:hypothetical protein